MTASERHGATCPNCSREFEYERYHAGFSNEGYMYCDRDETVLTWDAYDPAYRRLTPDLPWMLGTEDQLRVEAAVKPCPSGGSFAFANPPRCPLCHGNVAFLVPTKEYFVVTGRRVNADVDDVWAT